MISIKVIDRPRKPEEFSFHFRLVRHWSLPWENPAVAWTVQHPSCADSYSALGSRSEAGGSACPQRRNGAVGSGPASAAVSICPCSPPRGFRQEFCSRQHCGVRSFCLQKEWKDGELLAFSSQTAIHWTLWQLCRCLLFVLLKQVVKPLPLL